MFRFLWRQPALLLTLVSLFWAGNAIIGRAIAETFPPILLAQLRWLGAAAIVLPFAWPHLERDWRVIRQRWQLLLVMAFTGVACFNSMQYAALHYTTVLNVVLLQAAMPLLIAAASFAINGERLSLGQTSGIAASLAGVLAIVSGGDLDVLMQLRPNPGDAIFVLALAIYAVYSALLTRRPRMHWSSFLAVTIVCGAAMLLPATAVELALGARPAATAGNAFALAYVVLFPSVIAYAFFNRGVELIGPNRTGPFFHLVPLFGVGLAVTLLGERLQAAHVVGAALIAAGVLVASVRRRAGM